MLPGPCLKHCCLPTCLARCAVPAVLNSLLRTSNRRSDDEFLYNTSLRASWSICLTASFLCFSSTHPEVGEHVSALDVLRPELDLAVGLVLVTVLQVGEAHLEDTTLEAVGRNLRETRRCGKLTEMTSDLAQPYDDSLQANN